MPNVSDYRLLSLIKHLPFYSIATLSSDMFVNISTTDDVIESGGMKTVRRACTAHTYSVFDWNGCHFGNCISFSIQLSHESTITAKRWRFCLILVISIRRTGAEELLMEKSSWCKGASEWKGISGRKCVVSSICFVKCYRENCNSSVSLAAHPKKFQLTLYILFQNLGLDASVSCARHHSPPSSPRQETVISLTRTFLSSNWKYITVIRQTAHIKQNKFICAHQIYNSGRSHW